MARPLAASTRTTSTSTVGLPRLSRTSRALTLSMTDMGKSLDTLGIRAGRLQMGYVRGGSFQDAREGGTGPERKGDSDGGVADRFGGNVNWVGQSKRYRGRQRCR